MKVTFIIQDLFHQGAQYVTALMARGFYSSGYEVDILFSAVHKQLLDEGNVPFHVPSQVKCYIMPSRKARYNIPFIHSYVKKNKTDAVIVMQSTYLHAVSLASIGLKHKTRYCYVEHSSITASRIRKNKSFLLKSLNEFTKRRINCFMAVSKGCCIMLEKIMGLKPGSVHLICNPVIDSDFYNKLQRKPSCDWLLNKTMPTFVAAGAFCEIKGHQILFEAIRLVNNVTPARLVLFGKGYLQEEYETWINRHNMQDRILLAGFSSALPAELKQADAFVVSSQMESFSIVIVEALAAGVPVISTDCPFGPSELLHKGKYGTLVPVDNPQAMADALLNQILHPKKPAEDSAWTPFILENVVNDYKKKIGLE